MIYYVVWTVVALLALIGYTKSEYIKICSVVIIIVIVLFSGLRYERWTDWEQYYELFMNSGRSTKDFEVGYKLLNFAGRSMLRNYNIYLCILYCIVLILYYSEFKQAASEFVPICLFIFLSTNLLSSGGVRQFLACSITFFSIRFIREKNFLCFLMCIFLAATFHRTAVFFFPVFWVDKIKINYKILIATTTGMAAYQTGVFRELIKITFPIWSRFPSVAYRVNLYLTTLNDFNFFNFGFLKRTIIIFLVLLILRYNKVNIKKDRNLIIYVNLYEIGYLLSLFVGGNFGRLNNYFYVSETVLEVFMLKYIHKRRYKQVAVLWIFAINLAIWIDTLLTYYSYLFIPYKSCLF